MFTVRRRIQFEPTFPLGFEFGQLFNRQRISQMEGNAQLGPMREFASMHLKFGFAIEEKRHFKSTYIFSVICKLEIVRTVWTGFKSTGGTLYLPANGQQLIEFRQAGG